jgi:regulatory protein
MKQRQNQPRPDPESCRERAIGLLARREHSRLELKQKLLFRGCDGAELEALLNSLVTERLQSDERFTEAYVYSRTHKGFGPLRIQAELRERGIEDGLVHRFLKRDSSEWLEHARQQWRKRFGKAPGDFKERARQARFLQGRGFSPQVIRQVLNEDEWD